MCRAVATRARRLQAGARHLGPRRATWNRREDLVAKDGEGVPPVLAEGATLVARNERVDVRGGQPHQVAESLDSAGVGLALRAAPAGDGFPGFHQEAGEPHRVSWKEAHASGGCVRVRHAMARR